MKSNNIQVSVVIPMYNAEQFIAQAIQSVLDQELKNFEIILVNDGSTDASKSLCLNYLSRDNRIKFIDSENRGVSFARNLGLREAVGEYVYFLDADDTVGRDFLETAMNAVKKNKSDIIVIGEYYCKRIKHVPALPTCAMMLKRIFLNKYDEIRFPQGIQPCEDGLLSHQLLSLTKKIAFNPHGKHYYRQHDNQNHIQINNDSWSVINQIPSWLVILDEFYKKFDFYKSNSLNLAKFLKHELLELRYLSMKLDGWQKAYLFGLFQSFYREKLALHLQEKDHKKLGVVFMKFVSAKDHYFFDTYYVRIKRIYRMKERIGLLLVKMIPFSATRRRSRIRIYERFSL